VKSRRVECWVNRVESYNVAANVQLTSVECRSAGLTYVSIAEIIRAKSSQIVNFESVSLARNGSSSARLRL